MSAPEHPTLVPGRWFDGQSSKARPVVVSLRSTPQGPSLVLHPLSQPGTEPVVFTWKQVGWPEAWNERKPQPRVVIDLRDHGSVEIDAVTEWRAALAVAGERPGIAQRMQTRWPVLLGVTAAAVIGLTLFYRYGTPWAATQLTRFVPLGWETSVAENVLKQMDEGTLKPSKLPKERQQQLQARFNTLVQQAPATLHRYAKYNPPLSLEFRSGMGANAFALPGGKIVMTDGIVKAAADKGLPDDALVGVLAHEIGHVVHRHTTRMVVEQGVLNVGLGHCTGGCVGHRLHRCLGDDGPGLQPQPRARGRLLRHRTSCAIPHCQLRLWAKLLLAIARDEDNEDTEKKTRARARPPRHRRPPPGPAHPRQHASARWLRRSARTLSGRC